MHARTPRPTRPTRAAAALAALAVVLLAACGSGPEVRTEGPATAPPGAFEVATHWVRPFGDPEPVDLPAHRDQGDARPLVVYGSLTNVGTTTSAPPEVQVTWVDATGAVRATTPARVVSLDGAPVAALAPGDLADVVATVDDAATAAALAELTAELAVAP